MTAILSKRAQQGIFESLASANRDYGSGGGIGRQPLLSLGIFKGSALGSYGTANSSTWTDIAGTSFTVQVNRPTVFLYLVFATGTNAVVGTNGYIRGLVVTYSSTNPLSYGDASAGTWNGFIWLFSGTPVQPGAYAVKLQAATDAGGSITVTQAQHQFFDVGA